ncbi:DsbA family protein [Agrococcus sp. SGAir0287]|uniref:DsbA family protein n=1 Tax=Agrococcus sp. SGAir0287 TaxID=2070347 RepID=UPI0010CD4353|nr:thioredoxin domain-containing protein [Agrococcus sp. SGAir0287]QCR19151.1 disulfide bond formation protein DsbA [Agrococcus sp. SGAir0287]
MTAKTWNILGIVAAAVVIVGITIALVVRPWEQPGAAGPDGDVTAADTLDATTHVLDDAGEGAPVVVEFLDFECPSCALVYPEMESLRAEHAGEVTFAVRYFPLASHQNAFPAALAAEAAAQQGEFEAMYQRLFETHSDWAGTDDAAATFRGFAEELGLDMAAYDAAIADPATGDRIEADYEAGVALGVQSTPTIFIDGQRLELSHVDDIGAGIDAALAD